MSANFLDKSGLAGGIDLHTFFTPGPPPATAVPKPVEKTKHAVGSAHFLPSKSWHIAHSVTTDAWATLQSGWAMILVQHGPLTGLPPHPIAEIANIAAIVLTSSAAPVMSVHSVTGEGASLCTALVSCAGVNLDCGDFPSVSGDFNMNSVKTSPTLGDYIAAIVGTALNCLFSWALGGVLKKTGADKLAQDLTAMYVSLVQTVLDIIIPVVGDPVAFVIGKVSELAQKGTDAVTGQ